MKREIKFKAKRIDNGEWVVGSLIMVGLHENQKPTILQNGTESGRYERFDVHSKTVCQFTGLQDKNGVDIYESDNITYCNGQRGYVTFKYAGFCVYDGTANSSDEAYLKIEAEDSPIDELEFEIEVISNRHDNEKQ